MRNLIRTGVIRGGTRQENGGMEFAIDLDGQVHSVTVDGREFQRLLEEAKIPDDADLEYQLTNRDCVIQTAAGHLALLGIS